MGTQDSARFTRAIACAVADFGLRPRGGSLGFRFVPVTFSHVGGAIAIVKKNSPLATSSITAIIEELHLQQYFSYRADAKSEKHLTMRIAYVLPHVDATIKSLLPDVAWRDTGLSASAADLVARVSTEKGQNHAAPHTQYTVSEHAGVGMHPSSCTSTGPYKLQAAGQQADFRSSTTPSRGSVVSPQLQTTAQVK